MKTKLLGALILSVGCTALYFGIVRPEASTTPKRIQDFLEKDPATQPPVQMPPLVVSEPRLPENSSEAEVTSPLLQDGRSRDAPASTNDAKSETKK